MKMEKIKPYLIFTLSLCVIFVLEVAIIFKIQNYNTNAIIVDIISSVNIILIILKSYTITLFVTLIGLSILYIKNISTRKETKVLLLITSFLFVCFVFCLSQFMV